MAGKSQYIEPIKSNEQLRAFAYELGTFGTHYKVLFLLSLETGIWFYESSEMKVGDLKGKKSITYVRHHKKYTFPLSRELRVAINALCEGRKLDEYAFIGARTKSKLPQQSYINVLERASEICGIHPSVNSKSITRTFVYNLFLKDPALAMDYANKDSIKHMYDYLHMTMPEDKEDRVAIHSVKANFVQFDSSGDIKVIKNKVIKAISKIERLTKNIEAVDPSLILKSRQYLSDISGITDLFMADIPLPEEKDS